MGSVKDRIGFAMIDEPSGSADIREGRRSSRRRAATPGFALAFVCAARGYPLILVMPETMSVERRKLLPPRWGPRWSSPPGPRGMKGAVSRARQNRRRETPNAYFMPRQFGNPANPAVHRRTTAEEIWRDTDGPSMPSSPASGRENDRRIAGGHQARKPH